MDRLQIIKDKLELYNQGHLLSFYDELDDVQKDKLLSQLENIDYELVAKLYNERNKKVEVTGKIDPIPYIDKLKLSTKEAEEYIDLGEKSIKNGEYAFVTLAGGQGTRLGHSGPKGTFKLGIEPDKSLFEILCDGLKQAKKRYNVYVPWYIMTSRENNDDTVKFFEDNKYFGYPKEDIVFFKQGELPMLDESGKILLESKYVAKEAADGHGGIFEAMHKNKVIEDMQKRNVKWVFVGPIDNVLVKVIDPLFLGATISSNAKLAGKSIVKANPLEKVGVFCKRDGRPSVIEYTEISDEMAHASDEEGELLYGESHINCNLFNIEALKQIGNEKLPYHVAFKKCSYIESTGRQFIPIAPNAYKFETFIFDAFNKFEDMLIFRTIREEEFAPIKNKEGVDSVVTARKLYQEYWNI